MRKIFGPRPYDQKPPMAYDKKTEAEIIPRVIMNFPYPQRFCPFCEHELETLNAVHLNGNEEIFKSLMICLNPECGAYDEEARTAYVRAYYSCELALKLFETVLLKIQKLEKR